MTSFYDDSNEIGHIMLAENAPAQPLRKVGTAISVSKNAGYCVFNKTKVEMVDPQAIVMKNGKPAVKGKCPLCGGQVFKIGKLVA